MLFFKTASQKPVQSQHMFRMRLSTTEALSTTETLSTTEDRKGVGGMIHKTVVKADIFGRQWECGFHVAASSYIWIH